MNTLTGEGLPEVLAGASVVVDVSNSPTLDDAAIEFFRTATTNLLTAEKDAGVGHHVALSVVGTDQLAPQSGYFQAKLLQEKLISDGLIPYTIVHATQFFEFLKTLADSATVDNTVRMPPALFQPMAAADVAERLRGRVDPGQGVGREDLLLRRRVEPLDQEPDLLRARRQRTTDRDRPTPLLWQAAPSSGRGPRPAAMPSRTQSRERPAASR